MWVYRYSCKFCDECLTGPGVSEERFITADAALAAAREAWGFAPFTFEAVEVPE